MKKVFVLFIILSLCLFTLTGCFDTKTLESLSYVIAIGLDKGTNNSLKLTLQFASPSSSSSNDKSGSSQFSNTTTTTVECNSFESGINLINSYISNKVNLSHTKIVVISEDLAKEGIEEYICAFINNIEIRDKCHIIISKCSSEDFLNNSSPALETLSARYYEQALSSSKYTGFTDDISIFDFYSAYKSNTCQPIAILRQY